MSAPHGRLRVYIGMAPGVGKTYAMLEEGHRRLERGQDVVAGYVETYGRPATEALLDGLEVVARRRVEHRGVVVEEMDEAAIVARAPAIALIDELAHTNAPGSRREKRWQDIEAIRAAGIDVVSTCNVQHLESVADSVERLVDAPVRERVPDEVLRGADEIELVDLSPARLRRRMRRGEIYPADRSDTALERFFTEANLIALRDRALLFVARRVGDELQAGLPGLGTSGGIQGGERVLVVLEERSGSARVLARAVRLAGRLRAPIVALLFEAPQADPEEPADEHLGDLTEEATAAGAEVVVVEAEDRVAATAEVVRRRRISHLVVGQAHRGRLERLGGEPFAERVLRLVPELEVSVVGPGSPDAASPRTTF